MNSMDSSIYSNQGSKNFSKKKRKKTKSSKSIKTDKNPSEMESYNNMEKI